MTPTPILVAGLGSPHGDDQAGWIAAEAFRSLHRQKHGSPQNITTVCCTNPVDLLPDLSNFSTVILCDCAKLRTSRPPTPPFFRLAIPRPWTEAGLQQQFADYRIGTSSHGIELGQVLELAEIQNKFKGTEVVIYAIPGTDFRPISPPCLAVTESANAAAFQILADLSGIPGSMLAVRRTH